MKATDDGHDVLAWLPTGYGKSLCINHLKKTTTETRGKNFLQKFIGCRDEPIKSTETRQG